MKTIDKIKRQPTKWEKIFAIDRTEKGYPNTETAHTIQLEKKKKRQAEDLNSQFFEEDILMATGKLKIIQCH